MSNITFTMIKPDAVADGHIGAILGKIAEAGFKIKALKLTQLTVADVLVAGNAVFSSENPERTIELLKI